MDYQTQSFYIFNFILLPEELYAIWEELNFHFIITNTRVDKSYTETTAKDFFNSYKLYFQKLVSRKKWEQGEHTLQIYMSIIDSLKKVSTGKIIDDKYKLFNLKEPVIDVGPLMLCFYNGKFSTRYLNDEGCIGLKLSYPKYVAFEKANKEYSSYVDTSKFGTKKLFDELIQRIKKKTRRMRIQYNSKEIKPNIYISNDAKIEMQKNYYLKSNNMFLY